MSSFWATSSPFHYSTSQNVLKLILKSPIFVQFVVNMAHFRAKPDIPDTRETFISDPSENCHLNAKKLQKLDFFFKKNWQKLSFFINKITIFRRVRSEPSHLALVADSQDHVCKLGPLWNTSLCGVEYPLLVCRLSATSVLV